MNSPTPSPQQIIGDVANVCGIPAGSITGRRRTNAIVFARFLALAAIRKHYPHLSTTDLSACVRRKAHGSAINALHQFHNLCETNASFRSLATELDLI